MLRTRFLLIAAVVLAVTAYAAAQDTGQNPFHWTGKLASGKVLAVKGIAGDIQARAGDGDTVEITADKSGPGADAVRIDVVQNDSGIAVCAIYPHDMVSYSGSCDTEGEMHESSHGQLPRVNFTVRLPRNVRFVGRDVNGAVIAEDLGDTADLRTVNGAIRVHTSKWARLMAVNGNITGRFGSTDWPDELKIATVNGDIDLEMPGTLNADFDYRAVNGHFDTDFPLTVSGRLGPRHVTGKIGKGGRDLRVETVNGNVSLHKASM